MKLNWVIQDNLYNEDGYVRFIGALDCCEQNYTTVKVVPFAHELIPDINFDPSEKVLVMGSDSLIKASQRKNWWPGAFTNDNFHYQKWVAHHGQEMLNHDAMVVKFGNVIPPKDDEFFFIRPAEDFKIFAGTVITPDNFTSWQEKAVAYGDTLNADTEVIISSAKPIQQEFRFFIVNSVIITYSSYKIGGRVKAEIHVDKDVENYVRRVIQQWEPDYAYVMDIARTVNGFKIIEYNCINASGFYAADCQKIVVALTGLVGTLEELNEKDVLT